MKAFFGIGVRLMNHLTYPQKFLLVGLILVLPLVILLGLYLHQINLVIDFATREKLGLQYNDHLLQFMQDTQRYSTLMNAYTNADDAYRTSITPNLTSVQADIEADIGALNTIDQQLGDTLGTSAAWTELKKEWNHVKEKSFKPAIDAADPISDTLNKQTLLLITLVGNNSNLILDPDIDTYYIMDSLINKIPAYANNLNQILLYTLTATTRGTFSPGDHTRIVILSDLVTSTLDAQKTTFEYIQNYNHDLGLMVQPALDETQLKISTYIDTIKENFLAGSTAADSKITLAPIAYYADVASMLDAPFTFYNLLSSTENELLQMRIDKDTGRRNIVILFAVFSLGVSGYLCVAFYLAIKVAIADLELASTHMIKGQNVGNVVFANKDELARVAISFNNIARELVTARDQALESNRVKSAFLAAMSHELRTPLNAILNFSQFVATGLLGPVNEKQVEALNSVTKSGRHLLQLINDVLDISKIEAGALTLFVQPRINVNENLTWLAHTTQGLLKDKDVELIMDVDEQLPLIMADERRVRQILLNLVSNACKFTETGSITIGAHQQDSNLLFYVRDTGPGIPADEQETVFEVFQQTDVGVKYGGTGLGLPISKRLADAHGGRLWLESKPDQGTVFYVLIPIETEKLKAMVPVVKSQRTA